MSRLQAAVSEAGNDTEANDYQKVSKFKIGIGPKHLYNDSFTTYRFHMVTRNTPHAESCHYPSEKTEYHRPAPFTLMLW